MSEGALPDGGKQRTSQDKKNRIVAGLAVAAAVVFLAVVALTTMGEDEPSAYEVRSRCEDFADERLKAPATADYDLSATRAGDQWTVTGTVDAENGFGAQIRNTVTCVLHFEDDTAYLDDISID